MSIEEKIKADRQENADQIAGAWLPRRKDVEALGRTYAEDAFGQLGGADGDDVSWSFAPMEGDWDAFDQLVGEAADDEDVSEAFAGAYRSRLKTLVGEACDE